MHRARATQCPRPIRDEDIPGLPSDAGLDAGPVPNDCTRDEDCGSRGYCLYATNDDGYGTHVYGHVCVESCENDDDCASDELCACEYREQNVTREVIELGVCRKATCRTNADCDTLCISPLNPIAVDTYDGIPAPYQQLNAFHCQASSDACASRLDCPGAPEPNECASYPVCESNGDGFVCNYDVSYYDC